MKRRVFALLSTLALSLSLAGTASASGDSLISRSYLEGTYRTRLSTFLRETIDSVTRTLLNSAVSRAEGLFSGAPGAGADGWRESVNYVPASGGRGDGVTLDTGAGLVWTSGSGSVAQGLLIDATAGRETGPGDALAAGHCYIADQRSVVTAQSSARWMAEGRWMPVSGSGTPRPELPFTDVGKGAYFYDPVVWALDRDITTGLTDTSFGPDAPCTRGPKSAHNPFTDVNSGQYWYKAVLWAVEQNITTGVTDSTFEPDSGCTRGQAVTFLWRAENSPAASGSGKFIDVPADAYYTTAVAWAVRENITTGVTDTVFGPDNSCTRGNIVTFLYRDLA